MNDKLQITVTLMRDGQCGVATIGPKIDRMMAAVILSKVALMLSDENNIQETSFSYPAGQHSTAVN